MFAGKPPSSSDPTKRLCRRINAVLDSFRRLLLHTARRWGWCSLRSRHFFEIGGANLAGADRALERTYFVATARRWGWCSLRSRNLLRPFADEKHVDSLLLSTARDAIRFDCSGR
jgi:hypothetical protein